MCILKSATEVMPPATAKIFEEIRKNPLLSPFILIGGTALSLHIGHRVSEDLDFITLGLTRRGRWSVVGGRADPPWSAHLSPAA
jgi:hypothetical protein